MWRTIYLAKLPGWGRRAKVATEIGGYPVDYSASNHHGSKFVELSIVGPGGRFMR